MIDIVGVGGNMFYSAFPRDYNSPITGTMYTQLSLLGPFQMCQPYRSTTARINNALCSRQLYKPGQQNRVQSFQFCGNVTEDDRGVPHWFFLWRCSTLIEWAGALSALTLRYMQMLCLHRHVAESLVIASSRSFMLIRPLCKMKCALLAISSENSVHCINMHCF